MGKNSKSNEKHTLDSLGCNCSFSVSFVLHSQKSSESSFACHLLFQTILLCALSSLICLFLFSLYSYQPLKLNLLKRIHFSFFYFPSFFPKSECSSLLMQDLLFPYVRSHINSFFLAKYFSYLF